MKDGKTYRVKEDLVKQIKKRELGYILDKKETITEAEVVNALVLKGLETAKNEDMQRYIELSRSKKIR